MHDSHRGDFTLRACEGVGAFTREEWAKLIGADRTMAGYNPFLSHAFLSALEDSGCVARRAGWLPQFLRLDDDSGNLIGAIPCYLKGHSQGEYVFDHGWADAFERAGGRYYPKLQASVPFTPVTGPRLLVNRDWDQAAVRTALANGLRQLANQMGVSSAHSTFVNDNDLGAFTEAGFLHRTDQQFHFFNEGYESYDAFLETLASRKRKALKRERREAVADDITIERLTGDDITDEVWDDFFAFYMDTGSRKWGRPYLNREFYALIGERMPQDIMLVMAKRAGRYIAGAINFIGSDRLFGRHWGCIEDHRFLHFEVCYHQAIDFAIERKLSVVEAGAQGEHKLARGYLPVTTHSVHYLANEGLRRAVSDFLRHERSEVALLNEALSEHAPFKNSDH
ncbi:GNAT family N-acetyltransferase [Phyllobacterium sp. SYP-B3895]|uniref:GNAT family N-acetyltransferase n=1 Tax=Phyllobacterium sp. SYP-B3895 TaxID=2663240 RepID=UPI0012995AC9|nr:GNAT family N-acetyltransferase [Phyllobacterium sp. SYP-B3895]MRG55479.1 GNAT family N-acetyltransferase [Phyllobacterium sp. SYP-B3895]